MDREALIDALEVLTSELRKSNLRSMAEGKLRRVTSQGSSGRTVMLESIALYLRDDIPLSEIAERSGIDIRHYYMSDFGRGEGLVGYIISGSISNEVVCNAGRALSEIIQSMGKKYQ